MVGMMIVEVCVEGVEVSNESMILMVGGEGRRGVSGGYMIFYWLGSGLGCIV